VHNRAEISRTEDVVVAQIPTSAVAPACLAACPRGEDDPAIDAPGPGQTKRIRKVE
jgi:hypothetical protein